MRPGAPSGDRRPREGGTAGRRRGVPQTAGRKTAGRKTADRRRGYVGSVATEPTRVSSAGFSVLYR